MFKETLERIRLKSPKYFRRLRNISLQLGGSCLAIITLNSSLNLDLNSTFITIISYLLVLFGAIAGTSQLTKQ